MSHVPARTFAALLFSCIAAGVPVRAQTVPTPIEHNGISYVTGGIGEDEVHAFKAVAHQYNLRVTLATTSGDYLSDVDVKISSGGRMLLDVRTQGPFLFARVPAGRYHIAARDRHVTETKDVVVPRRTGIDVRFHWKDPDAHDVMLLCRPCPKRGH